jgi:hypothetical protein
MERLGGDGGIEYALTWKAKITPARRRYCQLAASARPISATGFSGSQPLTGWPTPNPPTGGRSILNIDQMDPTGRTVDGRKHTASLEHAVKFTGWATPTSRDHKDGASDLSNVPINCLLGRQARLSGAVMESGGGYRLNHGFSLWLMGYPVDEWLSCVPRGTPSSPKSRQSS